MFVWPEVFLGKERREGVCGTSNERIKGMDAKLYDLMNWPRIEALVYSEEDEPQEILGAHKVDGGILVQAFCPTAVKMTAEIRKS